MKKKLLIIIPAILLLSAFAVWFYVFQYSKTHHRNVESEVAITVSSAQIVQDYTADENVANGKYLNKAIQIKGEVLKWGKDQSGNNTVTLKSDDPFVNVFCTFKPDEIVANRNDIITVKGVCNGFLSDVVLNEAVLVQRTK